MARRLKAFTAENVLIEDITKDGFGIGRIDGRVVFVEKGVPGDRADVFVHRKKKGVLFGKVEKLIEASPERVEPTCSHFTYCGGCKMQNLSYAKQLEIKERFIRDNLERIGKVEWERFDPILGVDPPYHYRNKLEFSFGDLRWLTPEDIASGKEFPHREALGFHISGFYNKILDIDECFLGPEEVNGIRNEIRDFAIREGISFHNNKAHEGFLRNLVFRYSEAEQKYMLILIVWEDNQELIDKIFGMLEEKYPSISSFIYIVNQKLNDSYYDQEWHLWKGDSYITEELGDWKFQISPTSFFQTNTSQAKVLYDVVRKFIGEKVGTIYDLYCGAGSIGIYINDLADKIVGIEYVEDAVKDAEVNLKLNNLSHLKFIAGDMRYLLTDSFTERHGRPDVIVTDPPRAGMDKPVVEQLLKLRAPRIVYVSCGPATQARDLEMLKEAYELKAVQPVDMFPQTSHVENVVLLELRD